jgi:glutaredoxin
MKMKKVKSKDAISDAARRKIDIDFLYIDLTVCTRCKGTDANLDEALTEVSRILEATGVEVSVRKTRVESEAQAKALGFFSSPTIRINGKDIALEFRESRCDSCEACAGDSGPVNCRVWVFQGQEYTEAPKAMIVDAILREVYGGASSQKPPARPHKLRKVPDDLRRFFGGKAAMTATKKSSCCPPTEQADCCPPSEKAACCEPSDSKGCGCK